jgi:DNA-directed RNA polymerase subunit H (RpoH/RPB5)
MPPSPADGFDLSDVPSEHVIKRHFVVSERAADSILTELNDDTAELPPIPPALRALLRRGRDG